MIAQRMAKTWPVPDKIICSQALRAWETATIMSEFWWKERAIEIDGRLYGSSASSALEIIARIPTEVNSLALVFHNPTITCLSNVLSPLRIPHVPTCGIVMLRPRVESWEELEPGTCELLDFDYPKREFPPS